MKKLLKILFGIVCCAIFGGILGICNEVKKVHTENTESNQVTKKKNQVKFNQVGYYKSDNKYRCFAYTFNNDDEQQILAHAKRQMNTAGTSTSVYYFSNYNAKNISLCNSFFEAMNLCLDLDWKYEYSIYPNGKENFRKK